jgi:hypothetical protein
MTPSGGAESGPEEGRGLRERLSSEAEERIGRLADELLENPLVNSALQGALSAREKMAQAQETAMDALNLPSASTLDKLARRLRSISQRLDEIEDAVERLDRRLDSSPGARTRRCDTCGTDARDRTRGLEANLAARFQKKRRRSGSSAARRREDGPEHARYRRCFARPRAGACR